MFDRQRARMVLLDIAADMESDATKFDGQPFNGRTVAEYFGNQGAAIAAIAKIVEQSIMETMATAGDRTPPSSQP